MCIVGICFVLGKCFKSTCSFTKCSCFYCRFLKFMFFMLYRFNAIFCLIPIYHTTFTATLCNHFCVLLILFVQRIQSQNFVYYAFNKMLFIIYYQVFSLCSWRQLNLTILVFKLSSCINDTNRR